MSAPIVRRTRRFEIRSAHACSLQVHDPNHFPMVPMVLLLATPPTHSLPESWSIAFSSSCKVISA